MDRIDVIGQNGNDGLHYEENNEQKYVDREIANSTKLLGLIYLIKQYTENLYLNRLEHIDYCVENALKDADMSNFDMKRFNQTVKNKRNKINNGMQRAEKYYNSLLNDFNYNTEMDQELHYALIDRFDEFYAKHIKVDGTTLTIN